MPNIKLEDFEALVLVDLLIRFTESEKIEFEHESEKQVLYDLCALLENEVPELLDPKYKELLQRARETIETGEHY